MVLWPTEQRDPKPLWGRIPSKDTETPVSEFNPLSDR